MPRTAIVWFREDLRLHDNPALDYALRHYEQVIPLYLYTPSEAGDWAPGAASRWWLHHSLKALDASLRDLGGQLVIDRGDSGLQLLEQWLDRTGARAVVWNRLYTPWAVARDTRVKASLAARGIEIHSFRAGLLFEPQSVVKDNGAPYRVFTAFWKRCNRQSLYQPLVDAPARIAFGAAPPGCQLEALELLPAIAWDGTLYDHWVPGEAAALDRFDAFMAGDVMDYEHGRDVPGVPGTSRLSPSLHFGELSPRLAMNAAVHRMDTVDSAEARQSLRRFMAELGWREFAAHILFHYPDSSDVSMDPRFTHFPWREDAAALQRWQQGRTGIPIVDAGMRELWHTGWMHNRVRMLTASFLVKNLRLHWLHGARWFWDTLVDADLASNTLGWQWVAGCGTDAAPYFRIFNPVLQGRKFDPDGSYVRRWVPELKALDRRTIHEPWHSGEPADYPAPMTDLQVSREQALAAFRSLRGNPPV